jgi:hypothetical protein
MDPVVYFSKNQTQLNDRELIYTGIDDFEQWLISNQHHNIGWKQNIDITVSDSEPYVWSPSSQLIHYSSAIFSRFLTICSKHGKKAFIHLKINCELSEMESNNILAKIFSEYMRAFTYIPVATKQINFIILCKFPDYVKGIIESEFPQHSVNVIIP